MKNIDRIGVMLLQQKLITQPQLDDALALQQKKPYLRVGEILFSQGVITFQTLESLLEQQFQDMRVGQMLLRKGFINAQQLDEAIQAHEESGLLLGHLLIEKGFCTFEQVQQTIDIQKRLQENL
jgi:bacteriophage N4 adsorption protein B